MCTLRTETNCIYVEVCRSGETQQAEILDAPVSNVTIDHILWLSLAMSYCVGKDEVHSLIARVLALSQSWLIA